MNKKESGQMKVVINIPDEMYKWVNDANKIFTDYGANDFIDLVKKGTPIPKGHGDLIDREELLKLPVDKANYPSSYVKYVQAIIEKDKEVVE